jgi:hypothetical protein
MCVSLAYTLLYFRRARNPAFTVFFRGLEYRVYGTQFGKQKSGIPPLEFQ